MTVVSNTRKQDSLAQTLVGLAVNLYRDVKKRPFLPIWVDKEGSDKAKKHYTTNCPAL